MPRTGGLVAATVVVVFNLATLAEVARNRSGEPDASLQLTERELSLPVREAENTALALRLEWVDPELARPGAGWFDRRKLQEIGFDCRPEPTAANRKHYLNTLPRAAYAVLEYEGEAWTRYLSDPPAGEGSGRRYLDTRRGERDPARRPLGSHLVLVDVGRDAAALRARHPDRQRVVVAPAMAYLSFVEEPGKAPYLEGRVDLLSTQINVPRHQRNLLEALQAVRGAGEAQRGWDAARPLHEPRYRATVRWGRNLEPWMADVRALPGVE